MQTQKKEKITKSNVMGKWTEALRSGKYKQGTGALRKKDAYCCLGVLCDLVDPEAWKCRDGKYTFMHQNLYLPDNLIKELGIAALLENYLVDMNDGQEGETKRSFLEIAEYLEQIIKSKT